MNNEAKNKAKELIEWFMVTDSAPVSTYNLMLEKQRLNRAKQCALKVAKSELEVLEQARVFEQHDFYLELFKEIKNYE